MSGRLGADPQALDALGEQLTRFAGELAGTQRMLGAGVHERAWKGAKADRFRSDWDHQYAPWIAQACDFLHDAIGRLQTNANEQRVASGELPRDYSEFRSVFDRAVKAVTAADRDASEWLLHGDWTLVGAGVTALTGFLSAIDWELKAAGELGLHGVEAVSRVLGPVGLAIGTTFDVAQYVHNLVNDPLSDASFNGALDVTLDAVEIGTLFIPVVGPAVSAGVGLTHVGVSVVEAMDPELTSDVMRLTPIGLDQEVLGHSIHDLRAGTFNPINVLTESARDQGDAVGGLIDQASGLAAHARGVGSWLAGKL